jgi:hypothetical protein
MLFKNFQDAHNHLRLEGSPNYTVIGNDKDGILSLKIVAHRDSLNEFLENGKYIHYVGIGSQKTPGYPSLNQNAKKQQPFLTSGINQTTFPVLYEQPNHQIKLLGYYTVHKTEKKMSPAGFTYFMITLFHQY